MTSRSTRGPRRRGTGPGRGRAPVAAVPAADDLFPDPTAGMVLHRVLAMAARTFLLNDMGDELDDERRRTGTVDALHLAMGTRPLWAQSAAEALKGTERRDRSHRAGPPEPGGHAPDPLQPPDLPPPARPGAGAPPCGPSSPGTATSWGAPATSTCWPTSSPSGAPRCSTPARWPACRPSSTGGAGDVEQRARRRPGRAPPVPPDRADDGPVGGAGVQGQGGEAGLRGPARRCSTGPGATCGARPARPARTPRDVHLHQLRIRLKDLRYGSETVALVDGGPARKTARAAERLQSKLGDLHDVVFSIGWLEALAAEQPDLADAAERLVARPARRAPRRSARAGRRTSRRSSGAGGAGRADRPARPDPGPGHAAQSVGARPACCGTHSRIPPRMPAVLSTTVTSSGRWWRSTRRELPPPM